MEHNFEKILINIADKTYEFLPRLEAIIYGDSLDNEVLCYEVIFTVVLDGKIITNVFFNYAPSEAFLKLYKLLIPKINEILLFDSVIKFRISINVNVECLYDQEFIRFLASFKNLMFNFEITNNNSKKIDLCKISKVLVNSGLPESKCWLDNFGDSLANFDVILKNEFDAIKISRDFFWKLYSSDIKLIEKLVGFLKKKSNYVIVDGVDTAERYYFALHLGCAAQGYHVEKLKGISFK